MIGRLDIDCRCPFCGSVVFDALAVADGAEARCPCGSQLVFHVDVVDDPAGRVAYGRFYEVFEEN